MQTKPVSFLTVFLRTGGLFLAGVIVICALALAAAFAFTGGQAEQLDKDRVETTGAVIEAENYWGTGTTRDHNGRYENVRKADIVFRYHTPLGQVIDAKRHFSETNRDIEVGETFPVWYSESSPETFELAIGHKQRNSNAIRWIVGFFGGLFVIVFGWGAVTQTRDTLRVRDRGQRHSVPVLEPTRNELRHHDLGEHLTWHVKGMNRSHTRYPVDAEYRPKVGDMITVYAWRDDSVWEGEFGPPNHRS